MSAAEADVIPAIGSEIPSARVEALERSRIADNGTASIESQDSIPTAVEVQESLFLVNDQASRIGDALIIGESAQRLTIPIKGEERTVSIATGTGRAGDKERHRSRYPQVNARQPIPKGRAELPGVGMLPVRLPMLCFMTASLFR